MEIVRQGKIVGTLENGVFTKTGKQVVLFKKYNGFGFSQEILSEYPIKKIVVQYGQTEYITSPKSFYDHGIYYDDYGDKQLVLPRKWWTEVMPGQTQLF